MSDTSNTHGSAAGRQPGEARQRNADEHGHVHGVPSPTPPLVLDPDAIQALRTLTSAALEKDHIPALAYAVVDRDGIVLSAGLGALADGDAPDEHTRFRIASMTKSFTAAGVLALRDEGRLRLDEPVVTYVPAASGLRPPHADAPAITVRHLLTMSAGMATDDPWADRHLDIDPADFRKWLAAGAHFAFDPGVAFEYSNAGYGLLGEAIRAVTGASAQDFITANLLRPLGMHATTWTSPSTTPSTMPSTAQSTDSRNGPRVASPWRVDDAVVAPELPPLGDGAIAPMGGLWSTVADLAIWVRFLMDAYPPRDGTDDGPLRRASRREMQEAARPVAALMATDGLRQRPRVLSAAYAMGLQRLVDGELGEVVTHSGGLPGYGSNMRWLPWRGVGVIALANVTYAPMTKLGERMLLSLQRAGVIPAMPAPAAPLMESSAIELCALFNAWTDEGAARLFADNVALDVPLARRRADAGELVRRHGPLRVASVKATNATRGSARLAGDLGHVNVSLSLSPGRAQAKERAKRQAKQQAGAAARGSSAETAETAETADDPTGSGTPFATVQFYECTSVVPPTDEFTAVLAALLAAASAAANVAATELSARVAPRVATLIASPLIADDLADELGALTRRCGALRVGDVVESNGVTPEGTEQVVTRLLGERFSADLDLTIKDGLVTAYEVASVAHTHDD